MHDPTPAPHGYADHSHDLQHGGHEEGHGGLGIYFAVFVALCFLTGMSFFTYSSYWPFHDRPEVGWVFMMAVSCTKATLVMLIFMHLFWEANWKYVLTIPAAIMSVLLLLLLVPDIGLRMRRYSEERSQRAADVVPIHHNAGGAAEHDGHATPAPAH